MLHLSTFKRFKPVTTRKEKTANQQRESKITRTHIGHVRLLLLIARVLTLQIASTLCFFLHRKCEGFCIHNHARVVSNCLHQPFSPSPSFFSQTWVAGIQKGMSCAVSRRVRHACDLNFACCFHSFEPPQQRVCAASLAPSIPPTFSLSMCAAGCRNGQMGGLAKSQRPARYKKLQFVHPKIVTTTPTSVPLSTQLLFEALVCPTLSSKIGPDFLISEVARLLACDVLLIICVASFSRGFFPYRSTLKHSVFILLTNPQPSSLLLLLSLRSRRPKDTSACV